MKLSVPKLFLVLKEKGVRQKELANQANLSESTISTICNGKSCTKRTAEKIAAALGVTVDDLIETK